MEYIIDRIFDKSKILNVLIDFRNELYSLEAGINFQMEKANKFSKFGEFFVCRDIDNNILGFVAFYANDHKSNVAFISMIAVSKENRRNGIGAKLLNIVEEYSLQVGMNKIKLEVAKNNSNAIDFYKRHKYTFSEELDDSFIFSKNI